MIFLFLTNHDENYLKKEVNNFIRAKMYLQEKDQRTLAELQTQMDNPSYLFWELFLNIL